MAHMIQKRQRQTTIEKVREEERERERERGDATFSFLSLAVELGESLHPIIHITSQAQFPFNFKTFLF